MKGSDIYIVGMLARNRCCMRKVLDIYCYNQINDLKGLFRGNVLPKKSVTGGAYLGVTTSYIFGKKKANVRP
jgi:hypothetical protein